MGILLSLSLVTSSEHIYHHTRYDIACVCDIDENITYIRRIYSHTEYNDYISDFFK